MWRLILLVVSIAYLSGCASAPSKKDTFLSNYKTMYVRPIDFKNIQLERFTEDEQKEFHEKAPEFEKAFMKGVARGIGKNDYFDSFLATAKPCNGTDTIVLEPRIVAVNTGVRMVLKGSITYEGTLKTCDGKVVGKYSAIWLRDRLIYSTVMGTVEKMFKDIGMEAGYKMFMAKP
mgnify:CR=1 FL=1